MYACQYLANRELYSKSAYLLPYIEALHTLIYHYYQNARMSVTLRDEDICFPPTLANQAKQDIKSILGMLSNN